MKSPIRALFDILSGMIITAVMLFTLFLWAQAAGQTEIASWLNFIYKISASVWRIPENRPAVSGVPISHPSTKTALPQKAGHRAP